MGTGRLSPSQCRCWASSPVPHHRDSQPAHLQHQPAHLAPGSKSAHNPAAPQHPQQPCSSTSPDPAHSAPRTCPPVWAPTQLPVAALPGLYSSLLSSASAGTDLSQLKTKPLARSSTALGPRLLLSFFPGSSLQGLVYTGRATARRCPTAGHVGAEAQPAPPHQAHMLARGFDRPGRRGVPF